MAPTLMILMLMSTTELVTSRQTLPKNLEPIRYTLFVIPDLEKGQFDNHVTIEVHCIQQTDMIILHVNKDGNNLLIDENDITVKQKEHSKVNYFKAVEWQTDKDLFIIITTQKLEAGVIYILDIPFTGNFQDKTEGFYLMKYEDKQGKLWSLAATQFIENHARSAFPCFDEPSLKAVFSIWIARKETDHSFSNMPIKRKFPLLSKKDWEVDVFKDTPPLSTYQVSLLVTNLPLESLTSAYLDTSAVNIWYGKEYEENADPAAGLEYLQLSYLRIEYLLLKIAPTSLPKIDLIVLPFKNSNLTNWGIVTIREKDFLGASDELNLSDPSLVSESDSYLMFEGLTRQWFGGLVSPDDWKSFWLIEALANYLSLMLTLPEFKIPETSSLMLNWLRKDVSVSLNKEYDQQDDLTIGTFDYQDLKGTLLIRMLHLSFGDEPFQKSVHKFIETYRYKSAGPNQFWEILNSEIRGVFGAITQMPLIQKCIRSYRLMDSKFGKALTSPVNMLRDWGISLLPKGVTLTQVMDSWTDKAGYPVITVTRLQRGRVKVSQRQFVGYLEENQSAMEEEKRTCWWIPLSYSTASHMECSNPQPRQWLGCEHKNGLEFGTAARDHEWVIFNNKFAGTYRVLYDEQNWNLIINALLNENEYTSIDIMNRVQLVNDVMAFALIGDVGYDVAVRLLGYLHHEAELPVWTAFLQNVKDLFYLADTSTMTDKLEAFTKTLITPVFLRTHSTASDIKDVNVDDWKMRITLYQWSCWVGVDECISWATRLFQVWKSKSEIPDFKRSSPRGLVQIILATGIRNGNEDDFNFVFDKLLSIKKNDNRRKLYLYAISFGTFSEQEVKRVLYWATSHTDDITSAEDKSLVFTTFARRPDTFKLTLAYFFDYHNRIYTSQPKVEVFKEYITNIALKMNSDQLTELSQMASHSEGHQVITQAVEAGRMALKKRQRWHGGDSLEKALQQLSLHKNV